MSFNKTLDNIEKSDILIDNKGNKDNVSILGNLYSIL